MEIGAAAAGLTAGVQALWGYNRKNYLFDREMRQKNEFTVLDWRCKQAALWRQDLRDIIGLTEKKMDTYTIVSALQLTVCVGLFTEGRLAPGTPPWLLHFYMLTLAATFLYLLMSVWLAMHASIVAQCSSVRLLTQFVRLPVPTWQELESMRTYAQSFEKVGGRHMLRVPFVSQGSSPAAASRDAPAPQFGPAPEQAHGEFAEVAPAEAPAAPDPWCREVHGAQRGLYELEEVPLAMRRHVKLAERAAQQYKCFDAFARVAMTFGTNQLLQAITYYCLGYVSIQDGAPWAAWCVGTVMATIAVAMVHLDISLKRSEQLIAQVLVLAGPVCASCATWLWARHGKEATSTVMILLPMAYASHGLWLLWALQACGVERMPCGSILPTKFRAVLYLDVFGWLNTDQELARAAGRRSKAGYQAVPARRLSPARGGVAGRAEALHLPEAPESPGGRGSSSPGEVARMQRDLREHIALWQSDRVQAALDGQERARVAQLAERFQGAADPEDAAAARPPTFEGPAEEASGSGGGAAGASASNCSATPGGPAQSRSPWVKLHGYSDFGVEAPYLYDPDSGTVADIALGEQASSEDAGAEQKVRTITFAEEEVERFCSHAGALQRRGGSVPKTVPESPVAAPQTPPADGASLLCCSPEPPSRRREAVAPQGDESDARDLEAADVRPSGPSGAIPAAPPHAFAASSFLPDPHAPGVGAWDEGEAAAGAGRWAPGELPWRIFRSATLLLVLLWATGLAMPFGRFREVMTSPVVAEIRVESVGAEGETGVEHFAVGTDPSGLPEYIPETDHHSIPDLPEGELIRATWPSHSGFKPRALSRAPHGQQLVVADDFGVYVGQLFAEEAVPPPGLKSLRGQEREEEEEPAVVHSVHFRKAPPCAALEGHALKDISVACSEGASPVCRVLVLHTHGRRLVECPLFSPTPDVVDTLVGQGEELLRPSRPSLMWEISSDWLHGHNHRRKESVDSVAVNNECLVGAFNPNKVGCVVVGTTSGRIVQMRSHVTNETRLVPERAVEQWSQAVDHGSLHVFPNGYVVALHKRSGTIEAFDARKGKSIGEWRLPRDVRWMTVSGGGDNFYVMGRKNETEFSLWRFPVPEELRSRHEEAALPFGGRNF